MAWPDERDVVLAEAQGLPRGDEDLSRDEVDAANELGHGVLDLEPGVHLEEVEGCAVAVQEELARPCVAVPDLLRDLGCGLHDRLTYVLLKRRRRRLLEEFLVAALQRAVSLGKAQDRPRHLSEHLHLDVAWPLQVALEIDVPGGEIRLGLAGGTRQRLWDVSSRVHHPKALAAPAGHRLDGDGKTVSIAEGLNLRRDRHGLERAGNAVDPCFGCRSAGRGLVAHRSDDGGVGPDPGHARVDYGAGELGVFGEKAVTGMDRLGTRAAGRLEDRGDVEVGGGCGAGPDVVGLVRELDVQGVGVQARVDGHRAHIEVAAGPNHAHRNLAAIGNQKLGEHRPILRAQ